MKKDTLFRKVVIAFLVVISIPFYAIAQSISPVSVGVAPQRNAVTAVRRVTRPTAKSTWSAMVACVSANILQTDLTAGDVEGVSDGMDSATDCMIAAATRFNANFAALNGDIYNVSVMSSPVPNIQPVVTPPVAIAVTPSPQVVPAPVPAVQGNRVGDMRSGGNMCGSNPNWRSYSWRNGQQSCILKKYDTDSSYRAFIDRQNELVQGSCGWNNGGDDTRQETFGVCFPSSSYPASYPSGSSDTSCERISDSASCASNGCGAWNPTGWNSRTNSTGNCNFGGSAMGNGMMSGNSGAEFCRTGPSGPADLVAECVRNCSNANTTNPEARNSSSCIGFMSAQQNNTYTPISCPTTQYPCGNRCIPNAESCPSSGTSGGTGYMSCPNGQYWSGSACVNSSTQTTGSYQPMTIEQQKAGCLTPPAGGIAGELCDNGTGCKMPNSTSCGHFMNQQSSASRPSLLGSAINTLRFWFSRP